MDNPRIVKIIKVARGVGLRLPSEVVRDLEIKRGEFVNIQIHNRETIIAQRIKVLPAGIVGEVVNNKLSKIKYGK